MYAWDHVGGDPCPGDTRALRGTAASLTRVADLGRGLESRLRDLGSGIGSSQWVGDGADAMQAAVHDNVPELDKLAASHHDAAQSLSRYAAHLDDAQAQARRALEDYERAATGRRQAQAARDDAASRHTGARNACWKLTGELKALQSMRLAEAAANQPTSGLDGRIWTVQQEIHRQSASASDAAAQQHAADARIQDAESRMVAARRRIDDIRDEHLAHARAAGDAILAAAGIVQSHNPLVRAWNSVIGFAERTEAARTGLGLALGGALTFLGTRLAFRDGLGRFVSPARLSQVERELQALGNGHWLKSGSWGLVSAISKPLGWFGNLMDTKSLYDGLTQNDDGKITQGAIGWIGAALGRISPPLGVAAAAASAYGNLVIPTNNEEVDGMFTMVMRRQFGGAWDPDHPTAEQSDWVTQRYSSPWGIFNSISDGMDYKLRWMDELIERLG